MPEGVDAPRREAERWLRYARAFFNRRLVDRDDADSAANLTLARALATWDGRCEFRAYLIVCLRRAARDERRRQRAHGMTARGPVRVDKIPERQPLIEDLAWREDWVEAIDAKIDCEELLGRLEPQQSHALTTWSLGLSFVEIGAVMGVSQSYAHVLYHQAITRARNLWKL